jgi:hypothetical protein
MQQRPQVQFIPALQRSLRENEPTPMVWFSGFSTSGLGCNSARLGKKSSVMKNQSSMYVLQFLDDPACLAKPTESLSVEYRLLYSGTVYRNIIGDWSKNEGSRFLLAPPLMLYAASRPIYKYPLELLLRFKVLTAMRDENGAQGGLLSPGE